MAQLMRIAFIQPPFLPSQLPEQTIITSINISSSGILTGNPRMNTV